MSTLDRPRLHDLLFRLKLTRRVEDAIEALARAGEAAGPLALARGVEGIAVTAAFALRPGDRLAAGLASVGARLGAGVPVEDILAEALGRDAPPGRGKNPPAAYGDLARGLLAPGGHPATHLGVAAGLALGLRAAAGTGAVLSLHNEAAFATGDFHEAVNFIAVHELPVVVVLAHDRRAYSAALLFDGGDAYERFRGYGLPSLPVDGTDVLQMLQVLEAALGRARSGAGPTVVEAHVRRQARRGGPGTTPFAFELAAEEDEALGEADPVARFEVFLREHGLLAAEEARQMDERIRRLVDDGLAEARRRPAPEPATLASRVLVAPSGEER